MITTEARIIENEQEIVSLETGLKEVVSRPLQEPLQKNNTSAPVNKSLEQFLLDQQLDGKDIEKARQILGKRAETLSDEELKVTITEIRFLVESWLDNFEREKFKGLTLRELLHEKGGL